MEKSQYDKSEYIRGLYYVGSNIGTLVGYELSNDGYFENVSNRINDLNNNIDKIAKKYTGVGIPQLAGHIAEVWHAYTYNINAAVRNSPERAKVLNSKEFASVDISTNHADYQLKYCKDFKVTTKQISKSYEEYFMEKRKNYSSFENFVKKHANNLLYDDIKNKGIYHGQRLLVPADQRVKIEEELKRKISSESMSRPEQIERYIDSQSNLVSKIEGPNGINSMELTKAKSEEIAKLKKEGENFNLEEYGVSLDKLIGYDKVFFRSLRTGASAALVTATLNIIPILISAIQKAETNEEFDWDIFVEKKWDIFNRSGKSFVTGALVSAINDLCKKKVIKIDKCTPFIIGSLVSLIFDVSIQFIKYEIGNQSLSECMDNCFRDVFITGFGFVGAMFIPMCVVIGNIIGSVIGGFMYDTAKSICLSFSLESGYNCLGLVEQDYILPDYVLLDSEFDLSTVDECENNTCEIDSCEIDYCKNDNCAIYVNQPYIIRRGVITINRVGYIIDCY